MKLVRLLAAASLSITGLLASAVRAEPTPVTVGYDNWVGHAGVFVGVEKGLFEKYGIKVTLKSFPGPGDVIGPLQSGQLDIGLTTADTVLITDAGPGHKLINVGFVDVSTGADAIVVKKSIKSVADLKGKKVAASQGQCNQLLLQKALATVGLSEADVVFSNMDGDQAATAFLSGNLDAAATWEPWVSQITAGGTGYVAYSSKDAPDIIFDSIAVTSGHAQGHGKEIVAFLKGMNDGVAYLKAHPEEGQKITAAVLSSKPEDVKTMLKGVTIYGLEENMQQVGTAEQPGPVMAALDRIADFQVAHKVYDKKPDAAATVDRSYILKATAK